MGTWSWMDSEQLRELVAFTHRIADRYAPEWTSVKDKLPPNNQKVLFCSVDSGGWIVVGYRQGLAYTSAWYPEGWDITPTHWQLLPLLPIVIRE